MYWNTISYNSEEFLKGLTLTWDVLKFSPLTINRNAMWLTLTWDVLKWKLAHPTIGYPYGLTLTWDVLKSFYRLKNIVYCTD